MSVYKKLSYVILSLFMVNGHCAGGLDNKDGSGDIESHGRPERDERSKKMEEYREGLLKELLNGFEKEKPVQAIEENKKSFINYIKEKKGKDFNYYVKMISSCFFPGLYGQTIKEAVDNLLETPRSYRKDACYKENQRSIDAYDRFEAIKYFLYFFLKMYSSSNASLKKCSNIFTKIDNIIHSRKYEEDSVLSNVGFRMYIYECMSKLRISPQEACDKLNGVPVEEIQSIIEILDEIQASEEDFLRCFYDNTSLLQQYGLEDCATYEGEDKWKVDNMLFTMEGSTTGRDATKISIQSRFKFTTILKNFFPVVFPIALLLFSFYVLYLKSDINTHKSKIESKNGDGGTCSIVNSRPEDKNLVAIIYSSCACFLLSFSISLLSKLFVYKFLWLVISIIIFSCNFLCNYKQYVPAKEVLIATFIVVLLLCILKMDEIISCWLNLLLYDIDTLITEYITARRNAAISRYIKALVLLHHRISKNNVLRGLFKNEVDFFYSVCNYHGVDGKEERKIIKDIAVSLDYFENYNKDPSFMEVFSEDFHSDYSNISFIEILNQVKEILAAFAFNAAKIRANIKIFKDEGLRKAVVSALK